MATKTVRFGHSGSNPMGSKLTFYASRLYGTPKYAFGMGFALYMANGAKGGTAHRQEMR
jgi:hypothetical protein